MARDSGAVIIMPIEIAPKSVTITYDRPYFTGPKPLSGREQVVSNSSGGWLFKYNDIPLYGSKYRTFSQYMTYLTKTSIFIYVRPLFGPNKLVNRLGGTISTTYTLSANVIKGDTSFVANRTGTIVLQNGDFFEINGRLHRLHNIDPNIPSSGKDTFGFWPPLREAYASGTAIEITDPVCICNMTTNSPSFSETMDMGTIMFQSIEFIEANWPSGTLYP